MDYIYDGWMDAFIFGFKTDPPVHYHYKSLESQDIFEHISDCVRLKEESRIYLGWLEGE